MQDAEKLARKLKAMFANGMRPEEHDMDALCDHILSGDHRGEIENAAYERAAVICRDTLGWSIAGDHRVQMAAKRIRSLIQPPAQKEDGK